MKEKGLYLRLYHGFKTQEERSEAGGWGADGPDIGPLKWVHGAYMSTINIEFIDRETAASYGIMDDVDCFLDIEDGCIVWDGIQYGDFEVCYQAYK